MDTLPLQALLGRTWKERARAADALLSLIQEAGEGSSPWPEAVQQEIRALAPSPGVFLSALIGFWGEVAERQFAKRMSQPIASTGLERWGSPNFEVFPMTSTFPAVGSTGLRGMWVWSFVGRLGAIAATVESQLVACLDHPEPMVQDAAEAALGGIATLSDRAYARFVAVADERGVNGFVQVRARSVAKHASGDRVASLLRDITPGTKDPVNFARLAVAKKLTGAAAQDALTHLASSLDAAWSPEVHGDLIRTVTTLGRGLGFTADLAAQLRALAAHPDHHIRCAAARFVAEHGDLADAGLLLALAADPHPWVLADVCIGLLAQPTVPTDLLRALTTHCIGNYDGHDGLPHVSLMDLLVSLGNGAVPVLPEIVCWWDKTAAGKYLDRETVEEATRLCEVLGASAAALLPGLKRALAFLNEENVEEPMPALDEPGAVAVIQARIEQSMLDAGTDPTLATAVSGFHGAMLDMLAGNLDGLQAEIDAAQAESQAEMREIYPELFAEGAADASDQQAADADFEEQEDELIVRLRASIGCLAP